jgi:hypothetical protein
MICIFFAKIEAHPQIKKWSKIVFSRSAVIWKSGLGAAGEEAQRAAGQHNKSKNKFQDEIGNPPKTLKYIKLICIR